MGDGFSVPFVVYEFYFALVLDIVLYNPIEGIEIRLDKAVNGRDLSLIRIVERSYIGFSDSRWASAFTHRVNTIRIFILLK